MKLTPELLAQAPSTINPVKERQLDLRGKSTEIRVTITRQSSFQDTKFPQSKISV